jgi:hypothetical protein
MNSLFMMISNILVSFDITKDTDAYGNEIPINPTYQDGLIRFGSSSTRRISGDHYRLASI